MKVLVIDDEEDVRRIAHLSLANVGRFEVFEAAGGKEGVERARRELPDAILLDVMMPGMDGPATLAELQRFDECRHVPVVFVTARIMADEIERLKSLGAKGVLMKPFNAMTLPQDLIRVLR